MIVLDPSAIATLKRLSKERKAREDRMRNALEILSETKPSSLGNSPAFTRFVQRTAREGLGRETE